MAISLPSLESFLNQVFFAMIPPFLMGLIMGIYIPARCPDDWKQFLAGAEKHWKTGFSANALAFCWQEANGFPARIREVFNDSGIELFLNAEFLLGIPEHKVSLPGGNACSQNDVWVLARSGEELVSITVEGKMAEKFGSESLSERLNHQEFFDFGSCMI